MKQQICVFRSNLNPHSSLKPPAARCRRFVKGVDAADIRKPIGIYMPLTSQEQRLLLAVVDDCLHNANSIYQN